MISSGYQRNEFHFYPLRIWNSVNIILLHILVIKDGLSVKSWWEQMHGQSNSKQCMKIANGERYQYSIREIERAPLDVANDNYILYLLIHFISRSIYHIQLDKCPKLSFSNDFTKHICNLIFRLYKWSMTKIRCHLLPTKMAWHSICFPSCRNLEPCNHAQDQGNLTKAQKSTSQSFQYKTNNKQRLINRNKRCFISQKKNSLMGLLSIEVPWKKGVSMFPQVSITQ